jgi:hypothetical protein
VRSRLPRYSGHGEASRPDNTGGGTCRLGSPLPVCASARRFACAAMSASAAAHALGRHARAAGAARCVRCRLGCTRRSLLAPRASSPRPRTRRSSRAWRRSHTRNPARCSSAAPRQAARARKARERAKLLCSCQADTARRGAAPAAPQLSSPTIRLLHLRGRSARRAPDGGTDPE